MGLADTNYYIQNRLTTGYSTRNYIQYPIINHSGKEYEKIFIYTHRYVCVCRCKLLNHFAVLQKRTQLDFLRFIYFCRVFLASCGPSSVMGSRGYSLAAVCGPLPAVVSLVAECGLWVPGLQELRHMGSVAAAQGL